MLFKPELCQAILEGHKTQTRRLVQDHELAIHYAPGYAELPIEKVLSHGVFGRVKWVVGNTYAIQPSRGKKAIGRFRLLSIRRERLHRISREDALAEGVGVKGLQVALGTSYIHAVDIFEALWNSINTKKGTRWQDDPEVWVLEFKLVGGV